LIKGELTTTRPPLKQKKYGKKNWGTNRKKNQKNKKAQDRELPGAQKEGQRKNEERGRVIKIKKNKRGSESTARNKV